MSTTRVIVVAAIVLVGLLGLGAFAFAQATDGGPPWARGRAWHERAGGPGGWHGGERGPDAGQVREFRADLAADLAGELGSSSEDVEAAFRAVVDQRLQEAVDAGDLEQEQADDALAAYDEGDVRALFHRLKRPASGDN